MVPSLQQQSPPRRRRRVGYSTDPYRYIIGPRPVALWRSSLASLLRSLADRLDGGAT